jgi:hypothetical protein
VEGEDRVPELIVVPNFAEAHEALMSQIIRLCAQQVTVMVMAL